ncbi:MAG: DDRRRQL repeat protein YjdP [Kluyvera ascorbata]
MKRYLTATLFCALSLSGPLAHADIIDDAIGNIQQAINDAYNPASDREDSDDRGWDDRRSTSQSSQQYHDRRRQLDDRRRQLDDRQRQLDRERQQLSDEEQRLEDDDDR